MHRYPLIVVKFGSSVLRRETDLVAVTHEIYRWVRRGYRVLAVVSAIGDETNRLFERAARYGSTPNECAVAELVATGETTAAALLALSLGRAGIPCTLLDPARVGFRVHGSGLSADPYELDRTTVLRALDDAQVAVVPGYFGIDEEGRTALLGRGGSDLSALFLARELDADRCRLVKDVDGLYESDPAVADSLPRRYAAITHDDALALDGRVVQHKALRLAALWDLEFEVGALGSDDPTVVRRHSSSLAYKKRPSLPLRVGILGLGTVGFGVYQALLGLGERVEIVGLAARRRGRTDVDASLLASDPWDVLSRQPDVIVEALGGRVPASDLIEAALESGVHVVTANKAVIAHDGPRLADVAARAHARLLYSATVGGAAPMIETVERIARLAPIGKIEGILNGTTSFVMDRLAEGISFDEAVRLAQAHGFAEADPTLDFDGTDAAQKVSILARAAFGVVVNPDAIQRIGITQRDAVLVREATNAGSTVRLVGTAERIATGIAARVAPAAFALDHPFARARGEENCLVIETAAGERVVVRGKGAGRWPTTEAVIADILDLIDAPRRARQTSIERPNRNRGLQGSLERTSS